MATIVKEARYILTDLENNNNKFWTILLYSDSACETFWGRVGENGQSKRFDGATEAFFDSKCREKERKGYRPQKTIGNPATCKALESSQLAEVAQSQIETNAPETTELVQYLAKVNVHRILESTTMQYDANRGTFSTPLGIVTADAIADARALLTDIGDYVHHGDYSNTCFVKKLNDYLMLVPQNIGRGRPDPKALYPDLESVRKQSHLLDALEASLQAVLSAPTPEAAERVIPRMFEVRLHRVTDIREIERIRAKFRMTHQNQHACAHLDVKRVFAVEVGAMRRSFEEDGGKVGNIRELWHGTKASNLLSIMQGGFRIPPTNAPYVTGRMFGNGVYFSDQSTKSLNYAYGYWDGRQEPNCFMFLCDVAMGREYTPRSYTEKLPHPDSDSTFAKANASGVMNNEMIVYRTSQINPKYLIEFSPNGK